MVIILLMTLSVSARNYSINAVFTYGADGAKAARAQLACLCFQAEDGIRATSVTGVQTCALPISYLI